MVVGSRPANGVGKDAGPSGCRRGAEVPTKPGNAGGGKGPYFWCAWEGGKERSKTLVLASMPGTVALHR